MGGLRHIGARGQPSLRVQYDARSLWARSRWATTAHRTRTTNDASHGGELIQALKHAPELADTLEICADDDLVLRPMVTALASPVDPDVQLLAKARNASPRTFLTEFEATPSSPAEW